MKRENKIENQGITYLFEGLKSNKYCQILILNLMYIYKILIVLEEINWQMILIWILQIW